MMDIFLKLIVRGAIMFVCLLPLAWAAYFGRGCGRLVYYIDGRHRRMAFKNLELCFSATKTSAEIAKIVRENFRRIGENICCAIKGTSMDDKAMARVLEVRQSGSIDSDRGLASRNVVLASGHFGSFELFNRLAPHFRAFRYAATYRGIRQKTLEGLLLGLRSKCGMMMFERRSGAGSLRRELNAGGVMLILFCDQADRQNGLELPFLGRPAFTNRAPATMAARYDGALFAPICYRVGLGRYCIEMGEPIPTRDPNGERRSCEAITRDINSAFEVAILRDPANWFWVHNRWKQKIPDTSAGGAPTVAENET